jgi:hypothetical protein
MPANAATAGWFGFAAAGGVDATTGLFSKFSLSTTAALACAAIVPAATAAKTFKQLFANMLRSLLPLTGIKKVILSRPLFRPYRSKTHVALLGV